MQFPDGLQQEEQRYYATASIAAPHGPLRLPNSPYTANVKEISQVGMTHVGTQLQNRGNRR
jgi:hypothetical protein